MLRRAVQPDREENPDPRPARNRPKSVGKMALALGYPVEFFYADDPDELDTSAVSFRSLTKMSAKERDAAIAAGRLGLEVNEWLETKFSLPSPDVIDLSYETNPQVAAKALRTYWSLGERPIPTTLGLL